MRTFNTTRQHSQPRICSNEIARNFAAEARDVGEGKLAAVNASGRGMI